MRSKPNTVLDVYKLSVKINLSLLQSDIHWNPLHQNDSYLDTYYPYKKFLWYSVVITTGSTTGSTTGNYHRTSCGILGHYHRKVPHEYHRNTTGQYHRNTTGIPQVYHRNTTGIPQVSTTELPQEYHRSVVFWDITTGQYHTLVTTGIPQVSTTGQYHRITTGITTSWYHRNTTQHYHKNTTHYHRNTTQQYTTWIPYSTTMHSARRVATCSLVN